VDFWVSSCGFVGDYQRFGGTYRLHLQGWGSSETLVSSYNIETVLPQSFKYTLERTRRILV
jgi:hypothetical protein